MDILIFGGGAIGSHLAYCLTNKKNRIFFISRGKHLKNIKKNGLKINIYQNDILKKKNLLKENKNLKFYSNIDYLKKRKFDYIFITVKLKNFTKKLLKEIIKLMKLDTAIIPPCTELSDWWLDNSFDKKNSTIFKKFRKKSILIKLKKNIIGMTMWLSAVITSPGIVKVRHIQRGYPLKEIDINMKSKADMLRSMIKKRCLSPTVKNIYSEIYIKVINSFAFNLIALKTGFNNAQIKQNKNAIYSIKRIMKEFEKIVIYLDVPIYQSIKSRINQTLSSKKHTMSMLTDFKKKKSLEINFSWKRLYFLSKLTNIKTNFSLKTYKFVYKKIYNAKRKK